MSGNTVLQDMKISSKGAHIECINEFKKKLKGPLKSTKTKSASKIILACFTLYNFVKWIILKHA